MNGGTFSLAMGVFPPYGFLNAVERLETGAPLFPPDFRGDATAWNNWFNATLQLITEVHWPRFDQGSLTWVGQSAAFMRELTETELRILRDVRKQRPNEFDKPITTLVGSLGRPTHRTLYHAEDGFIANWGNSYDDYDVTLPTQVKRNFSPMLRAAVLAKVGNATIRFKIPLQRPRAYQMAFILGFDGYDYEEGVTANTPSTCCGHCMQALLGVGGVMEQVVEGGVKLSDESWAALEQFSVDIGDRRVMAGVHYPSDALCSWLISMRLAPHIYRARRDVIPRLWHAIRKRSFVYKLIEQAMADGIGNVFQPAMRALEEAAEMALRTTE